MPHNRFFLDTSLTQGKEVFLEKEELHHLVKVMRVREDETVELINGKNQLAKAKVLSIQKNSAKLILQDVSEQNPSFPIILCQAICRMNRLDTLIEKGTELGATEFWLFPAALSEKKALSPEQMQRLQLIAISAIKQSGRLDLPQILLKPPLTHWKDVPFPAYFGDTNPEAPSLASAWKKESGVCFFVGPESGFTEREEEFLKKNLYAKGIKLHSNILRTETAPLVALSLIHHWLLDSD